MKRTKRVKKISKRIPKVKKAKRLPADAIDLKVMDIIGGHELLRAIVDAGEIPDDKRDALFEVYQSEMPYGTQKARTGDPDVFMLNELAHLAARLVPSEEDLR